MFNAAALLLYPSTFIISQILPIFFSYHFSSLKKKKKKVIFNTNLASSVVRNLELVWNEIFQSWTMCKKLEFILANVHYYNSWNQNNCLFLYAIAFVKAIDNESDLKVQ